MKCQGSYRDHLTRELQDCDETAEPGEEFCRDCSFELDTEDPDWAWNARHEMQL